MGADASGGRRAGRGVVAALFIGMLLAGCAGQSGEPSNSGDASAAAASKANSAGGASRDLPRNEACKLATNDEVAAVLGAPVVTAGNPVGVDDQCTFVAAGESSEVVIDHVSNSVGVEVFNREKKNGRPIAGLGDEAFATADADRIYHDAEVQVRRGALVLTVGYAAYHVNASERPVLEDRLAKLAGQVLTRLPS